MAILTNADVARRVRGLAAEKNLRPSDLADALHMSRMSMWRRLNGETPLSAEDAIRIARVLEVPAADLFRESHEAPSYARATTGAGA